MTNTQLTGRKKLYRRIRNLSDRDIARVAELVDSLEGHEPNEETLAVLQRGETVGSKRSRVVHRAGLVAHLQNRRHCVSPSGRVLKCAGK